MMLAPERIPVLDVTLDKPFYSPPEVAELAQVSSATIHNWIKAGRLVAVRLSERTYRIPRKSVMRLLDPASVREPTFISNPDAVVE
jgi:excisionase family DNA binding protein